MQIYVDRGLDEDLARKVRQVLPLGAYTVALMSSSRREHVTPRLGQAEGTLLQAGGPGEQGCLI